MKRRVRNVLGIMFGLWIVVGFGVGSGYAKTNSIDSLNPNEYKEKEFKDNTEYFHNDSLLKNKKGIPEAQKQLDFVPENYNPNEKIQAELFVQNFQERKSVAYESMKLGLFSEEVETVNVSVIQSSTKDERNNKGLQYIYIGLLCACVITVLIWLVPKLAQGEKS